MSYMVPDYPQYTITDKIPQKGKKSLLAGWSIFQKTSKRSKILNKVLNVCVIISMGEADIKRVFKEKTEL